MRSLVVQNDEELSCALAEAGEGVCLFEDAELIFPLSDDSDEDDDAQSGSTPSTNPESARERCAARLWTSLNPRPGAAAEPFVEAAAAGDEAAIAVLNAWAPHPFSRPNLGVRSMKHDRALCELVFERAKTKPRGLAALIGVLAAHAYYPAARRPEFAALAKASKVDVSYFVSQAKKDAAERKKWFGVSEPLD